MLQNPTSWGRPWTDNKMDAYGGDFTRRQQLGVPVRRGQEEHDAFAEDVQRTQQPIVTGTSVIGLKYKDGVMLAADNLASYGSLARFKDIQRLHPIGTHTVIGAAGDMSDFQYMQHELEKLMINESNLDDGHTLGPTQIYSWLSTVLYARRSKFDPLWNSYVLGGVDATTGEPFLGYVDLLGTTYSSPTIGTGYASMIAQPLLRKAVEGRETSLTEEEATEIVRTCMRVLFYRDARSLNKFQIAKVTKEGVVISPSMSVETEWSFAEGIRGYGAQTQ